MEVAIFFRKFKNKIHQSIMSRIPELDHLKIPLHHIKLATNNFADHNLLGYGGFGKVYKGQLPVSNSSSDPGTIVAVKRLDMKGGQGRREFLMEIVMLASYKHHNLVSLIGFSDESGEKIIVYKFEAHGSLDKHIATTDLTWLQRLRICLGAARGLEYLHGGVGPGHRVLHRDIKSSNILLDANWEAKISDFGLSKIGPTNQELTFLVTNPCGTFGYLDPLYLRNGVLTKESDVYSFGVVLFEVLCGRLAVSSYEDERKFLSGLVKLHHEKDKLNEIIIPNLREQMSPNSLEAFSRIAYQCLNEDKNLRPTMGLIVQNLKTALELQTGTLSLSRLWGSSTGGAPWSLKLDTNKKLRKITIDHEDWIYSIGFTTEDLNGSLESSPHHGGANGRSGGMISEINFDADEEITEILGTVGVSTGDHAGFIVISSLCFVTNKKRDGPFGRETGTPFSVPLDTGSFAGFYGRSGFYLDGLGCYLMKNL